MKRVIARSNFASRPPIEFTAIVWLVLDRYHVGQVWWGMAYTVLALLWIAVIYGICTEKEVDVLRGM